MTDPGQTTANSPGAAIPTPPATTPPPPPSTPPAPQHTRSPRKPRPQPRPKLTPPPLPPGLDKLPKEEQKALRALIAARVLTSRGRPVSTKQKVCCWYLLKGYTQRAARRVSGDSSAWAATRVEAYPAVTSALGVESINPGWIVDQLQTIVGEADQARDKISALMLLSKLRGLLVDLRRVDITRRQITATFNIPLPALNCPACGYHLVSGQAGPALPGVPVARGELVDVIPADIEQSPQGSIALADTANIGPSDKPT